MWYVVIHIYCYLLLRLNYYNFRQLQRGAQIIFQSVVVVSKEKIVHLSKHFQFRCQLEAASFARSIEFYLSFKLKILLHGKTWHALSIWRPIFRSSLGHIVMSSSKLICSFTTAVLNTRINYAPNSSLHLYSFSKYNGVSLEGPLYMRWEPIR